MSFRIEEKIVLKIDSFLELKNILKITIAKSFFQKEKFQVFILIIKILVRTSTLKRDFCQEKNFDLDVIPVKRI